MYVFSSFTRRLRSPAPPRRQNLKMKTSKTTGANGKNKQLLLVSVYPSLCFLLQIIFIAIIIIIASFPCLIRSGTTERGCRLLNQSKYYSAAVGEWTGPNVNRTVFAKPLWFCFCTHYLEMSDWHVFGFNLFLNSNDVNVKKI